MTWTQPREPASRFLRVSCFTSLDRRVHDWAPGTHRLWTLLTSSPSPPLDLHLLQHTEIDLNGKLHPILGSCPKPCISPLQRAVHWRRQASEENVRYVFAAAASPGGCYMHPTCGRLRGSTAPFRQHPHRAYLSPTSRALLACHPALSLNASLIMCLSSCPPLRMTTNYLLACSATRRRGRYMRWLRHAITTFIRRYSSPRCLESHARAYIFNSPKSPICDYAAAGLL